MYDPSGVEARIEKLSSEIENVRRELAREIQDAQHEIQDKIQDARRDIVSDFQEKCSDLEMRIYDARIEAGAGKLTAVRMADWLTWILVSGFAGLAWAGWGFGGVVKALSVGGGLWLAGVGIWYAGAVAIWWTKPLTKQKGLAPPKETAR